MMAKSKWTVESFKCLRSAIIDWNKQLNLTIEIPDKYKRRQNNFKTNLFLQIGDMDVQFSEMLIDELEQNLLESLQFFWHRTVNKSTDSISFQWSI